MRTFDYRTAESIDEVIGSLGNRHDVRPLAGGTDLITLMKAGLAEPDTLCNIKGLGGLRGVQRSTDGAVEIGALTTLAEIELDRGLGKQFPVLTEAASLAATPQLRAMATIGGNLLQRPRCWYFRNHRLSCWLKGGDDCPARDGENQFHALFGDSPCVATHPSDLAPALLALGAEVRVVGQSGERTVPLEEFFALPEELRRTETTLGNDELITAIRIPSPAAGSASHYQKAMDRKVWAFALVSVAAALRVEQGRVAEARVVLGGVAPVPWRSRPAEEAIVGEASRDALWQAAAEAALRDAQPLEHNGYKVPLARALVARTLAEAAARAGSS